MPAIARWFAAAADFNRDFWQDVGVMIYPLIRWWNDTSTAVVMRTSRRVAAWCLAPNSAWADSADA